MQSANEAAERTGQDTEQHTEVEKGKEHLPDLGP